MKETVAMANLQVDPAVPALTSEQSLTGWRRELCVELLGNSQARIFLRAVESPSMKADELHRCRLVPPRSAPAFDDLESCVQRRASRLSNCARTAVREAQQGPTCSRQSPMAGCLDRQSRRRRGGTRRHGGARRLHGWRLNGAQKDPRLTVCRALNAEFSAPAGQALLGCQRQALRDRLEGLPSRRSPFIRRRSAARAGECPERCRSTGRWPHCVRC